MLSQTGTYALQAALHLARREGSGVVPAARIAEVLDVPATYLAKVLHRMTREGVLESVRGPRGGYRLRHDPGSIRVSAVVAPFQELRPSTVCLLGGACDLDNPCPAHEQRRAWTATALEMLEATSLADLLNGPGALHLPPSPTGETES
ncbi:MAG TPA: Rrf2 family transcriptional regulator [Longimicrobiales bacterium]|nr:Rrf2 family transcriptional regulator [Longimicrobiales bacterium]